MARRILPLEQCLPVAAVAGDAVLARDGALTLGWRLTPPDEYTLGAAEHDAVTAALRSALLSLPPWTMVHRQDIYRAREYRPDTGPAGFLDACFSRHFEGRPYLEHLQYVWFTFNPAREGRAGVLKGGGPGAAGGVRYHPPATEDLPGRLARFELACAEFISVLCSAPGYGAQRVRGTELEGGPGAGDGLLQEYLRWFGGPLDGTDISLAGDGSLERDSRRLFCCSFCHADDFPGEISNTFTVRSLSDSQTQVLLSGGGALGSELPFPHTVNAYFVLPDREYLLRELDRRRRLMTAMSGGSGGNAVAAGALSEFIALLHAGSADAAYTHLNVTCWGPDGQAARMRGAVGAAASSLGLAGKLDTLDTPRLWLAAMPGGELEIGEDNLMLAELSSALCLCINETYTRGFPGGALRICDRRRRIPVRADTQQAAFDARLIENYNAFILGPSGSGKSFFTNWYVRNCFDAGQHVFIIDKGGSYEALCALVREETGGRDGVYRTWTREHPFTFSPLEGCRGWAAEGGDPAGLTFFISLLRIIWSPAGGWDTASDAVLFRIVTDFVRSLPADGPDPFFDDFLRYVSREVRPRILGEDGAAGPYLVGGTAVTPALMDIASFCVSMDPYAAEGRFAFLLNGSGDSGELFSSRFVVFEMDEVSRTDSTLYALCTFCIIDAFARRMRSDSGTFRLLFIEEAWQAVATEGTAAYLRELWKTARKYHASATVVTQQVSDIIGSEVVRDAILNNSPVRILLDQRGNAASLPRICDLLDLSDTDRAQVRSVGRALPPDARWREVWISLGGRRSRVYALEVSPEEALLYESDRVRKRPLLELAAELGSIRRAASELASRNKGNTK